jgi:predicted dienelactone hydrolase
MESLAHTHTHKANSSLRTKGREGEMDSDSESGGTWCQSASPPLKAWAPCGMLRPTVTSCVANFLLRLLPENQAKYVRNQRQACAVQMVATGVRHAPAAARASVRYRSLQWPVVSLLVRVRGSKHTWLGIQRRTRRALVRMESVVAFAVVASASFGRGTGVTALQLRVCRTVASVDEATLVQSGHCQCRRT